MSTPAPLTGRMHKVCMYCHERYGQIPCLPAQDGKESHGICHALACRQRAAADYEVPLSFFDQADRETAVPEGGSDALRTAQDATRQKGAL